jgi:hypothetical protein
MRQLSILVVLVASASCMQGEGLADTSQAASAASPNSRWPVMPIHFFIDGKTGNTGHASATQTHCGDSVGGVSDIVPGTGTPSNAVTVKAIGDAVNAYRDQTPVRFVELTTLPASNPGYPVLIYTRGATDSNPHAGGVPATDANGVPLSGGDWQGCVFLPPGEMEMHTIEHETGHQLGFIHEQRRSDYCSTVTIDETCLSANASANGDHPFKTITSSQNLAPYDTSSIMEYGNTSFCDPLAAPGCNDAAPGAKPHCARPTIMKIGCTTTTGACAVGGATDFSQHDINALYRMYEPSLGADETNDQLGATMAAGDFDGDGYTDLAVGAPFEAPGSDPSTGAVFLYKGTEGGLVAWKVLVESDFVSLGASVHAGDKFGAALAAGHYFNHTNPAIDDLIVGAPGYRIGGNAGGGAAYVYRGWGTLGSRQPTPAEMWPDPASGGPDGFGSSVAMGVIDGTHGAIAVGAPTAANLSTRNGMAFYRNANAASWTVLAVDHGGLFTPAPGTNYGAAIAIGGSGLAIGAPGLSSVYIYNAAGSFIGLATPATHTSGDKFGMALAYGHFWSGSPLMLAVGAPFGGTGGTVTMFELTTTVTRYQTFTQSDIPGMVPESGDQFGAALAAGDIDGDGVSDLAIGSPGENAGQGVVAFLRGLTGWTWRGEKDDDFTRQAGDHAGTSVAIGAFGDAYDDPSVANDEFGDVAVGAPGRQPGGVSGAGAFQTFFGTAGEDIVFGLGYDEHRVNGIQPQRTGAPAPLSCTIQN